MPNPPCCFEFEAPLPDNHRGGNIHVLSIHPCHVQKKGCRKAACGLYCVKHGLDLPNYSDWYTETKRHGDQECYNVMVDNSQKNDNDCCEPRDVFIKYMSRHAQRNGEVELHRVNSNASFIKVCKKDDAAAADDDDE
jgi:hypothetical protein